MLAIPVFIIIAVFVLSVSWLLLVIVQHKKILSFIRQVVDNANNKDLDNIYEVLSDMADNSSSNYIVVRSNADSALKGDMITLPTRINNFPWAGKVVHISPGPQTTMVINNENAGLTQLGGRTYTIIPVPLVSDVSGQDYIQYSPYKWLDQNKALASAVSRLSLRHAEKILSYLVTPGKDDFNFEPAYQVRIGGGISWVDKPISPLCDNCGEPMSFILQCPGSLLNHPDTAHATFYLFGCKDHPDQTICISQYQ